MGIRKDAKIPRYCLSAIDNYGKRVTQSVVREARTSMEPS